MQLKKPIKFDVSFFSFVILFSLFQSFLIHYLYLSIRFILFCSCGVINVVARALRMSFKGCQNIPKPPALVTSAESSGQTGPSIGAFAITGVCSHGNHFKTCGADIFKNTLTTL